MVAKERQTSSRTRLDKKEERTLPVADKQNIDVERMKRVSVIGCCGTGKSTLSKKLHSITNLPLIHLDKEFWSAGWQPSDKEEFQSRMRTIYNRDQWITDGHYFSTMDARLSRSDTVFHLDYSTLLCLYRTLRRIILGLGRDRSDCAGGCPERFDWEFIRYVALFRKTFRRRTIELLSKHNHLNVYTFRSPLELKEYLAHREQKETGTPLSFE